MLKIIVQLETITPLFLYGAKQDEPEFRSPPFRGMMRYWFRALAGGVLGDSNEALKKLREAEAQVFGSPDDKHGQSAVWVRLSASDYNRHYKTRVLPHRGDTWTNYLGKTLKNYPKPAIPPGVRATLTLTLKPNTAIPKLEIALWSLLVGLTLGGIGKRSRRGFGSLRIQAVQELPVELSDALRQQLEQAAQLPATGKDLAQRIGKLLTAARNAFSRFLNNPTPHFTHDLPQFPVLKPDTHIVIWTPEKEMLPAEYDESVLAPLMRGLSSQMATLEKEEKGIFAEAFGGANIRLPGIRERFRRASPLWVSTHRTQNGGWALVLTHLKSQYLPQNPGNKHHLVTTFLNTPPSGWTKTEVAQ